MKRIFVFALALCLASWTPAVAEGAPVGWSVDSTKKILTIAGCSDAPTTAANVKTALTELVGAADKIADITTINITSDAAAMSTAQFTALMAAAADTGLSNTSLAVTVTGNMGIGAASGSKKTATIDGITVEYAEGDVPTIANDSLKSLTMTNCSGLGQTLSKTLKGNATTDPHDDSGAEAITFDLSSSSKLDTVTFENCPNLNYIHISGIPKVETLTFSACPKLIGTDTWDEAADGSTTVYGGLWAMSPQLNSLTTLNLTGEFPCLRALGLKGSALEALDLSKCAALEAVYIYDDSTEATMTKLTLGENPKLKLLKLKVATLTLADFDVSGRGLTELYLDGCDNLAADGTIEKVKGQTYTLDLTDTKKVGDSAQFLDLGIVTNNPAKVTSINGAAYDSDTADVTITFYQNPTTISYTYDTGVKANGSAILMPVTVTVKVAPGTEDSGSAGGGSSEEESSSSEETSGGEESSSGEETSGGEESSSGEETSGGEESPAEQQTPEEKQAESNAAVEETFNEETVAEVAEELGVDQDAVEAVAEAAEDATKELLNNNGVNMADLNENEQASLAKNMIQIELEKSTETTDVVSTTAPAANDLPLSAEGDSAVEQLNELPVQPKVVEAEAEDLSTEETAALNEGVAGLDSEEKAEIGVPENFSASDIRPSSSLTISSPTSSLAGQGERVTNLFTEIRDLLTTRTTTSENGKLLASALSPMSTSQTGYHTMSVNLRNVAPRRRLRFWNSPSALQSSLNTAGAVSVAAVQTAAEADGDPSFFLDETGTPTSVVSGDASKMKLVAYLRSGTSYENAFITVDATPAEAASMDQIVKEVKAEEAAQSEQSQETTETPGKSSSSSGCDAGFGLFALLPFALFGLKRK